MSPNFAIASLLSFVLSSFVLFFSLIDGLDKGSHTNVKNSMKKSRNPPLVTVLNLNLSHEDVCGCVDMVVRRAKYVSLSDG